MELHPWKLTAGTSKYPCAKGAKIQMILGDEMALKQFFEFKGASGKVPCFCCKNVVLDSLNILKLNQPFWTRVTSKIWSRASSTKVQGHHLHWFFTATKSRQATSLNMLKRDNHRKVQAVFLERFGAWAQSCSATSTAEQRAPSTCWQMGWPKLADGIYEPPIFGGSGRAASFQGGISLLCLLQP